MVENQMDAILVRVCSYQIRQNLGKSILDIHENLIKNYEKEQVHCCGEGGEFESFVLNCPLFKKEIVVKESEVVVEEDKPYHYVARLNFIKLEFNNK